MQAEAPSVAAVFSPVEVQASGEGKATEPRAEDFDAVAYAMPSQLAADKVRSFRASSSR